MQVSYNQLAANSRVWIYQADRQLTDSEIAEANQLLQKFSTGWAAHGAPVHANAEVFYKLFLVFFADIDASSISGCSIDSSVQVVKALGDKYGIDFFNRLNVVCKTEDGLKVIHRSGLEREIELGSIRGDSLMFDNLIQTKEDFESVWEKPLSATWAAV
ncbi:MAG: hypothetical protein ACI959_000607 [Limisphaerales bacterium]|jgi:hypothetical protein